MNKDFLFMTSVSDAQGNMEFLTDKLEVDISYLENEAVQFFSKNKSFLLIK